MKMYRLPILDGASGEEWNDNPVKRFKKQLEMWADDDGVISIVEIFDFLNESNHPYIFEYHIRKNVYYYDCYNFSLIMTAEVATLVKMFCDISGFTFEAGEFDDTQGIFLKL